jgi:acetolactate synthase small subunit
MAVDTITFEITDTQTRIDAFLAVLTPFGIEEMVQTGVISMMRGSAAARPGHPTVNARPVRAAE